MNRPHSILDGILERSNFSPRTRGQYESVIGDWIEFAGPHPSGWTRLKAQHFYDGALARGVKISTANNYISCLRYVSHWFAIQHGGEDFALIQIRDVSESRAPRRALTAQEVLALLATCDEELPISKRPIDRRDRTMLIVGLETGMRSMSLAGSLIENINTRQAYPFITVPVKGKGGRRMFDVPLSDTAMLALHDWLGWLRSQGVKDGPIFRGLRPLLDQKGHRAYAVATEGISQTRIYQTIRNRAEQAQIEHVHPHLLRHTFITWRVADGVPAPQIAAVTGHNLSGHHPSIPSSGMGELATYSDAKLLGGLAREFTPPWFAQHVRRLIDG